MGNGNKALLWGKLAVLVINALLCLVAIAACLINMYNDDLLVAFYWICVLGIMIILTLKSLHKYLNERWAVRNANTKK